MSKIVIYETENQIKVEVTYESDSLWLSLNQISELFDRDKSVISRHIKNVFKEKELTEYATVAKNATVQKEGAREVTRDIEFYNLAIIIAVGYRVSSAKGTQFRIWANNILKDYLVQGYAINEKRLAQKEQEVQILKNGIHIFSRTVGRAIEENTADDTWLAIFAKGLTLLDDYDHEQLDAIGLTTREAEYPSLEAYQKLINQMLTEFDSDVFGK